MAWPRFYSRYGSLQLLVGQRGARLSVLLGGVAAPLLGWLSVGAVALWSKQISIKYINARFFLGSYQSSAD